MINVEYIYFFRILHLIESSNEQHRIFCNIINVFVAFDQYNAIKLLPDSVS